MGTGAGCAVGGWLRLERDRQSASHESGFDAVLHSLLFCADWERFGIEKASLPVHLCETRRQSQAAPVPVAVLPVLYSCVHSCTATGTVYSNHKPVHGLLVHVVLVGRSTLHAVSEGPPTL